MINKIKIFHVFCFFTFFIFSLKSDAYLCSYPRSGNNWWMYCIQETSGQSFLWMGKPQITGSKKLNQKLPAVIFKHNRSSFKGMNKKKNKLITIVRNPYESIIRNYKAKIYHSGEEYSHEKEKNFVLNEVERFLSYLELYDSWAPETRLIVYYDEMTDDCKIKTSLQRSLSFLLNKQTLFSQSLSTFVDQISEHRKKSIKSYNRLADKGYSPSFTEGKSQSFSLYASIK